MARILMIEDNRTHLELMSYFLKAYGYKTVLTAMDGEDGLEGVRRTSPDLIVCDIQLLKLDGFGIAAQLKRRPAHRTIPLIAVTALAMVGDRDKLLSAGFDGYVSKPIDPEKFVSEIEAFIPSDVKRTGPPVPQVEPEEPARQRGTILVVDNSLVNLSLAASTLEPFGYDVITAHNVNDGLRLARQNPPELILSDIHMPHQSGFDFIRAVKADRQLRSIPFIFISSTVWRNDDQKTGLALGADKFILRPVDPQDLLREIEECLGK
jgi:two-component system cell cycle response regulator